MGGDGRAKDTSQRVSTDQASGTTTTAVGQALGQGVEVPLASLLAEPASYLGKNIRVEGQVTAMCTHRRGWFALAGSTARGEPALRVLTHPNFLVPAGVLGQRGRAEGVVELRELSGATRSHQLASHGLADPGRQVVLLRATGSEFIK